MIAVCIFIVKHSKIHLLWESQSKFGFFQFVLPSKFVLVS